MEQLPEQHVLAALVRIERSREPLVERDALAQTLALAAEELSGLCGAAHVEITLHARLFARPLPLPISAGALPTTVAHRSTHELLWAGVSLGHVHIVYAAPGWSPGAELSLLLRSITEVVAETVAAEFLVQEATARVQRWLAFEIHDSVKSLLPGIRLLAESAEREIADDPARAVEQLRRIREAAQQGVERLSLLVDGLRGEPVARDLHLLLDRLVAYYQWATPQMRFETRFDLPDMSADTAACVLSVVRNALSNAVQHAQASLATLVAEAHEGGVLVSVADDGVGLAMPDAVDEPGIGLESIIERVTALRGRWVITRGPLDGTCVEVWLPLLS